MHTALRCRHATLALGLSFIAAACDSQPQSAPVSTSTTTTTTTHVDANGVVKIVESSYTIEIDAAVRYQSISKTDFGAGSGLTQTINGAPFEVREGRFLLGQTDLGPVPAGAKVRVTADGVFVDGERRGATPKPLEPVGG